MKINGDAKARRWHRPALRPRRPRKDERVRGGRGIAPGMAGGDPQARGIASRSSSTASPKGKPRRRRWGFLCPTKVEDVLVGGALCTSPHSAAPGIVRPLRPPQLLEIAILRFGVIAREPGYAEQSTSPIRDIRRRLRLSGLSCGMTCAPWP